MNRGSAISGANADAGRYRFNEAPIHESGKSPITRIPDGRARGFNEAPIHESGKY